MDNEEYENFLKQAFNLFDYEQNETIDPKVLTASFIEWKYAEKYPYIYQIICNMDQENLIGGITFDQFKDVIFDSLGDRENIENIHKIFTLLDLKRNDKLDKNDLKELFTQAEVEISNAEIEEIIKVLSSDGEKISRQDFVQIEKVLHNIKT